MTDPVRVEKRDEVIFCGDCGNMVCKALWEKHAESHEKFDEVVEVLRAVSERMFREPGTLSEDIERRIAAWRT